MNKRPKVSMIIPIFNGEQFLKSMFECVLSQDYSNIEVIAVNDASTDSTGQILGEYIGVFAEKGFDYVICNRKKNGGLCAAINEGLKVYSGDYICFPDVDDYLFPNYISAMVNVLGNNTNCGWVRCDHNKILEYKNRSYAVNLPMKSVYKNDFYDFMSTIVPHNTWNMMVRSEYFKACIGEKILDSRLTQEWSLLLPLSYYSDYARCPQILYSYYMRTGAMHTWQQDNIDSVIEHIDGLDKLVDDVSKPLFKNEALFRSIKLASDIRYSHFKWNTYKKRGLSNEVKKTHTAFIKLAQKVLDPATISALVSPDLIMRCAMACLLQLRIEKNNIKFESCYDALRNGYVLVGIDVKKDEYVEPVNNFFGKAIDIVDLKKLKKPEHFFKNNHCNVAKLLLIRNSKIETELKDILLKNNNNTLVCFREMRDAMIEKIYKDMNYSLNQKGDYTDEQHLD